MLNAYFPMGHNPGGFRCWWRRLHGGSDDQLDDTHLMRMAGRFARRVKAWAAANGVPVIYCKAGERKHLIAEEYLETHSSGAGVFLILVAKAPASGVEGAPVRARRSSPPGEEDGVRLPLQLPHHGPGLGAHGDQDVRAPAVRRAGDPQRPRVRRGRRAGRGDRLHEGGQLFYWNRGSAGPGPGRRCLVAARGYRAPGPGLRPVDLHRLPVLRPGPAEQERSGFRYDYSVYQAEYSRNLLFTLRRADGGPVRPGAGPDPVPAGHPRAADPVRPEEPAAPATGHRAARAGSRDRETYGMA